MTDKIKIFIADDHPIFRSGLRQLIALDLNLEVIGEAAREWMGIAQAFAGPPGAGRQPGEFPREAKR